MVSEGTRGRTDFLFSPPARGAGLASPPGVRSPAAAFSPRLLVRVTGGWRGAWGWGGVGSWISISRVPCVPVLTTSGVSDVPQKSAPSVNINSLVLIPLEAHEWNKHILSWLCHGVSCQDQALTLGDGRGGWWGWGEVPASHGGRPSGFRLVGSKPPEAVLSRGTQSPC